MRVGIADRQAERPGPAIGDGGERRIERGAQRRDRLGQGISEIAIGAAAETVARHHHLASIPAPIVPAGAERRRLRRAEQRRHHRAAMRVELGGDRIPVDFAGHGGVLALGRTPDLPALAAKAAGLTNELIDHSINA